MCVEFAIRICFRVSQRAPILRLIGIQGRDVSFLIYQLLNSLTLSAMLFLVAVGLSLVFGVLRIINFAHGVFYLLGAYTGFALVSWLGSFWLACVFGPVIVGAIGAFLEIINLRPLYRSAPIYQLLVTFGLALILEELVRMGFGSQPQPVEIPKIVGRVRPSPGNGLSTISPVRYWSGGAHRGAGFGFSCA